MERTKGRRMRSNAGLHHHLLQRHLSIRAPILSSSKSNPYVGWFRHAPSSANKGSSVDELISARQQMKKSPYVGWFRHSPSSRYLVLSQKKCIAHFERELKAFIALEERRQKLCKVDGYLRGGTPSSWLDRDSLKRTLHDTSETSTSATIQVLSRLANWFLFPLAHDQSSCGYRQGELSEKQVVDLFPHVFPTGASTRVDSDDDSSTITGDNDDQSSKRSEASDGSSVYTIGTHLRLHVPNTGYQEDPQREQSQVPSEFTVSSLAEAYYAHQAAQEFEASLLGDSDGDDRLDHVITQMDIARMARNASRHLDVESILSLPTITFHKIADEGEETGSSWMLVPPASDATVETCVICMEQFEEGDRLRVLPCSHSFHVGCIDVWLSGSHSFDECYTSGCPTCKKRPDETEESSVLDGSVPSWAFAQLGGALMSQSLHT